MTGIDAKLVEIAGGLYDIQIDSNGDIKSEDSFDAAIIVSLFSDKRASESEVATSHLRRGWIGNESTPGIEIGSLLWLFEQSRLTGTAIAGLINASKNAIEWFVEDNLAIAITDIRSVIGETSISIELTIRRPNSAVEKKLFELWDNTGVS